MHDWLTDNSRFLILVGLCGVAFAAQYWWLRKNKFARLPWRVWILALVVLGYGWHQAGQAGMRERTRIQSVMQDFARLYGDEMEVRGHWKLPNEVAGNDPLYLRLIETERNWEAMNPDVSDIYTLRKRPDGKNIFLVDSETDYNRDGKYDEAREQRTPVGEVYDKADEGLERAFRGEANFDFRSRSPTAGAPGSARLCRCMIPPGGWRACWVWISMRTNLRPPLPTPSFA